MGTTRSTLLLRVKDPGDSEAWSEFHKLYAPLLYRYARGRGLSCEDAEDTRDQCLEVVALKIADFEYDRKKGEFKNWLYRIANGKVVDLLRKRRERVAGTQELQAIKDPHPAPDEAWETQWRREHLRYCLDRARGLVSTRNFEAFEMLLLQDCSVADVCAKLGMNANQVYQAKSRVLKQIRDVLADVDVDPGIGT